MATHFFHRATSFQATDSDAFSGSCYGPAYTAFVERLGHRVWDIRYMMSALSVLECCAPEAGLSPEIYGEEIGYALRYCVFAGWAVQTETGRLRITEAGRREYEAERFEWYS